MFSRNRKAKNDFEKHQLPSNRKESIKDILSLRWTVLIKVGFILLLFGIPLMIHQILINISIYEIELAFQNGNIDELYARQAIFDTINTGNLIFIPLLVLFGIGLSGGLRVLRQLIWQEPIFFWHDLKQGIKSHALYVSLSIILIGIANFFFNYIIRGASFYEDANLISFLIGAVMVLLVISFYFGFFVITQTTLYQLSFYSMYKNAFLLTMRYFFQAMIYLLMLILPWLILFVDLGSFYVFVFCILFVITPFQLLVIMSYAYGLYDDLINKNHHQDIYRKGLFTPDADLKEHS